MLIFIVMLLLLFVAIISAVNMKRNAFSLAGANQEFECKTADSPIADTSCVNYIKHVEINEFHVLGKMGYYLASNDEDDELRVAATPLQDLEPKDLA